MVLQNLNNDCLFLIYDELPLQLFLSLTSKNNYQLMVSTRRYNKYKIKYLWKYQIDLPLDIEKFLTDHDNMINYLGYSIINNPSMIAIRRKIGPLNEYYEELKDYFSGQVMDHYFNDLKYDLLIAFAITACFGILLILIN